MDPRPIEHWKEIIRRHPFKSNERPDVTIADRIIGDLIGYRWDFKERRRDAQELANALNAYRSVLNELGYSELK